MKEPQNITALRRANQIRLARAASKRRIRADANEFRSAIDAEYWETATVKELLMAIRGLGESKVMEILRSAECTPATKVISIGVRRKLLLLAVLELQGRIDAPS